MKVKISVPTNLSDIKLSQYQKLLRTTKDSEDAYWINKQTVGILCGLTDDVVKQIHKRDFNDILKTVSKVIEQKGTFKPIITYKGREYGFIPNLDEITVGEQADIDSQINDYQKMHKVMAIMYRPIKYKRGDKYTIEPYTGQEEPLDLTMDIVNGVLLFFYNLLNDLLSSTQNYIKKEVLQTQTSQLLEENGVGIKTFMHSLDTTFLNLKASLNLSSMKL